MREEDDLHEPEHDHLLDNEYLEDAFDTAPADDVDEDDGGHEPSPVACR